MCTEDVDFFPRVAEEGADPMSRAHERPFARCPVGLPVAFGHDEEQVVRIGGDVSLPNVLQVMIVVDGSTALDLGEDPAAFGESKEEVRAGARDEPALRSQDDLLTKPSSCLSKVATSA